MTYSDKRVPGIEAFILAAGKSSRLGDSAAGRPKCLVEVNGVTLLTRSLAALAAANVTRVHIVVGCKGEVIRDYVATQDQPLPVNFIENPYWDDTGSMVSLALAVKACPQPWSLVLESDLLFHPGFLSAAIAQPADRIMVADASGSGDEVWVIASKAGYLQQLGKTIPPELQSQAIGEFAGISLFSESLMAAFCTRTDAFQARNQATGHYEEHICDLSREGFPILAELRPGLPWTEVDTPADLERARTRVAPALSAGS